MKEAIGSTFSITAIVVFLIVVNCFLAFSVNYTKAFRAKNEIRSIIEKYEGITDDSVVAITDFLAKNNYHISIDNAHACEVDGYQVCSKDGVQLFCYKEQKADITGSDISNNTYKGAYYTIATYVNVDIPMLGRIFPDIANIFKVKGETALIYSSGVNYEGTAKACGNSK